MELEKQAFANSEGQTDEKLYDLERGPDSLTSSYGTEQPAPPDYNQVQKDAPPSYQSIFGEIRDARAGSAGIADFLGKLVAILINTLCCTILMAFLLAVPIITIVIGSIYKDDCPAQKYIPIYLIVAGSFSLVKNIIDLCTRLCKQDQEAQDGTTKQSFCSFIIGCFLFGWFIAGNVWIYGTDPDTDNVDSSNYCHGTVYYFAYWLTTATYIMMGFFCCCFCCAACMAGIAGGPAAAAQNVSR